MKIKALKNLIVFGAFAFILLGYNNVLAYVPGVWDYQPTYEPNYFTHQPTVDYYYYEQPVPVAVPVQVPVPVYVNNNQSVTPQSTTPKTVAPVPSNTDNASNGNNLTALSMGGSGSFMPSSIWQWLIVIVLILIIVIMARLFVKKPEPGNHGALAH